MIQSFADQSSAAIFYRERGDRKARQRLPTELWDKANEVLDALDAAEALGDVARYDLEALSGDRSGQFSLRINRQYRVCFEWDDPDARRVEIVDYH